MTNSELPKNSIDSSHEVEEVTPEDEPSFGWNAYAEVINGRVAMLAIIGLLVLEWCTNQDLWTWLGLR